MEEVGAVNITEVLESLNIPSEGNPIIEENSLEGVTENNINTVNTTEEKEEIEKELLPLNPGLIKENTSRFSGADWFENINTKTVLLAGIGGIGSYVAFMLSRVNVGNLILYDPDIVETVNMSGQLFSSENVNGYKVNAISQMIQKYSNYKSITSISQKFRSYFTGSNIMICGFDNMRARKDFYTSWKRSVDNSEDKSKYLFIDGRLNAEEFQVFCITGDDVYNQEIYQNNWLFSDYEADPTVCSYKQTTYMANMIASIITNLFINFVSNECDTYMKRDLPFLTEYSASTMFFKTIN